MPHKPAVVAWLYTLGLVELFKNSMLFSLARDSAHGPLFSMIYVCGDKIIPNKNIAPTINESPFDINASHPAQLE